ncbi:hypothetical protein M1852_15005 (plasmid) [Lactiplantibacillus plantarum]|nr:hypothetical protein [Lactiplantibacillus plantarum]WHQ52897.1 hypothetical protein M1852_15005 [Lactiplantibacillus plantarum]
MATKYDIDFKKMIVSLYQNGEKVKDLTSDMVFQIKTFMLGLNVILKISKLASARMNISN